MLGYRLALERRRLKLSQREVAEFIGLSRSAIAMYETDRCPIDADRLAQLAKHGFDLMRIMLDEPGRVAAGRLLDWQLSARIAEHVEAWASLQGNKLPPGRKALALEELYLRFAMRSDADQASLSDAVANALKEISGSSAEQPD